MIPKPLDQIEWEDLESLKASGREESDTIEFKSSFSGGEDFLDFSESQREKAIRGIAREAVAFLNGRGGDIVIGAEEESNAHPRIANLRSIPHAVQVADRLAQSLNALIEPYQSVLSVRAIRKDDADRGVLIVRCPESLRAPHRFMRDKECYIRRGRESVAMPMDEIQDLTITRTARRSDVLSKLDSSFADIGFSKVRRVNLPHERLRIKVAYRPLVSREVAISKETLSVLRNSKPKLILNSRPIEYLSVLDCLDHIGQPMLRGRIFEGKRDRGARQVYCATSVSSSMALEWDYVDSGRFHANRAEAEIGLFDAWVIGFLAQSIFSLGQVLKINSSFTQGILRIGYFSTGEQKLVVGDDMFSDRFDLPEDRIIIPDFELSSVGDLIEIFGQVQDDFYAIAGVEHSDRFELVWP